MPKIAQNQSLNIHFQENYDHPQGNSYSLIKLVKITLSKDENHGKVWFLECVNKKTMKRHGFCEPRLFKIALTVGCVCFRSSTPPEYTVGGSGRKTPGLLVP
jgi:hypothetical protein